jgi:crotonobetainyl-CoA:carnitine CoA-transferase CaiB-like acyl-CoA transferase
MVDTSLMEAGIAYSFWESTVYFYGGEVPGPLGSAHRLSAPYQAFRTRDGYMNIGGATQRTWEGLCRAIGREELAADPRFVQPGDRKAREVELAATLEQTFSQETTAHWLKLLDEAGVPCGPINDLDQVYHDPHVLARQMLVEQQDPEMGALKNIGIPVKLSLTPGRIRRRAPDLGEHTREVLLEAGYTADDVDRLRDAGVVKERVQTGWT